MKHRKPNTPVLASIFFAALAAALPAHASFIPVPLTADSYTQDMVVEKTAPTPVVPGGYTTASMDGGTNNDGDTWNEVGYFLDNPDVGLPTAGSTFTSASATDHSFTMAPSYTTNNAVMLDAGTTFAAATLMLPTPAAYGGLSFLTSGGNGGCIFRYTVHHQDGSTETGTTPSADWFGGSNPAWTANGRVNAQSFSLDNLNSNNPRLYAKDVTLTNTSSPITTIELAYVSSASGAHTCIMAISGSPAGGGNFAPITVTGYNADIVVEATATHGQALTGTTTASMDGGTANTGDSWYERGYNPLGLLTGLPAAGASFTNESAPDHVFAMPASYSTNNAVFLDSTATTGTLTLASPSTYFGFSILSAAAGGNVTLGYQVHHTDGSSETGSVVVKDWFGGTPTALTANGRVNVENGSLDNLNSGNPRLYAADFAVTNTTSPVETIALTFPDGGTARAAIFALSGSSGPLTPFFDLEPQAVKVSPGETAIFTSTAGGTPPLTYQWQQNVGGVFVNLTDSASIAGSASAELTLSGTTDATAGEYRVLATNAAGTATSNPAILTVLSSLPIVTTPTDSITLFGGSTPTGQEVAKAIDQSTDKYLNFGLKGGSPFTGPVGLVVTPSMGRTVVTALQFYTGSDAPERDPADYKLEGSNDGGSTYALISSGPLALPDARNNVAAAGLDPANQAIQQVIFPNTSGYTTYRISFANVKDNNAANSMQIGEVAILGVADTSGVPAILTQPLPAVGVVGGSVQFVTAANGTPAPSLQWYKKTGSSSITLVDGVNVTGATGTTLTLSNLSLADAGDFFVVASNSGGVSSSSVAHLTVISALHDVTAPGDTITAFGDDLDTPADPATAIDDTTSKYVNGGSGFSTKAGFPPFQGPVGFVVTPAMGSTVVTGLRIYAAEGNAERDPADYKLEGSNDGVGFSLISTGLVTLAEARNAGALALDPLTQSSQEILFSNNAAFTSYRVTFTNTKDNNAANSLQLAEIELLGTAGGVTGPSLGISLSGTNLTLTFSQPGTLQGTTELKSTGTIWTDIGPVSGSLTTNLSGTAGFYRVKVSGQ